MTADEMLDTHMGLIVTQAKRFAERYRYAQQWVDIGDFIQAGCIQVARRWPRYDPTRCKVQAFISVVAAQGMMDLARNECNMFSQRIKDGQYLRGCGPLPCDDDGECGLADVYEPDMSDMEFDDLIKHYAPKMRPREREIARMFFIDRRKMKDIAPVVGLSESRISYLISELQSYYMERNEQ